MTDDPIVVFLQLVCTGLVLGVPVVVGIVIVEILRESNRDRR